ncbi:MAG: OmpH family outer membrane protein [Vampirovibrionales bacterium]|nr:OmpH family outer membrane protein [Vampirovibrionales bacterium]
MMKKRMILASSLLATVCAFPSLVHAEMIGYVNFEKVFTDYDKAQGIMADMKVKEADLRKLQADFVKQIEETRKANSKNPVANETLEKELSSKLNTKVNEYRDWSAQQQKIIESDIKTAVQKAASTRGVDVVLTEQAVFQGGLDLTADVLTKLNAAAANNPPAKTDKK